MSTNEIFIDVKNLPKLLPKQEVYALLDKIKQGDIQAKNKLTEHSIVLVVFEVIGRFKNVQYDKKDLVSIGILGLMKAITTFDISKEVDFSTYAKKCIDNEILMFLRKLKRYNRVCSLNTVINDSENSEELTIGDTLSNDVDIFEEYTKTELRLTVRKIVEDLPPRDREIVKLYFGFYNDRTYNQIQIAEMLSISQPYVARLIKKLTKQIGKKLEQKEVVETTDKVLLHKKRINQIIDGEYKRQ